MENQIISCEKLRKVVLYYAMTGLTLTTFLTASLQHFHISSLICILIMPAISIIVCLIRRLNKNILISAVLLQTAVLALNIFYVLRM